MKNSIKRIDWKLFHVSAWIMMLLAYILPFAHIGENKIDIGYPFPFLFIYRNTALGRSPFASVSVIVPPILMNLILIYVILFHIRKAIQSLKKLKKANQE